VNPKEQAALRRICDAYADTGRHIEAGWIEYCSKVRAEYNEQEFNDARAVFFAGARSIWRTIVEMSEAAHAGKFTEQDGADFLYQVYKELQQQGYESDYPTAGNA